MADDTRHTPHIPEKNGPDESSSLQDFFAEGYVPPLVKIQLTNDIQEQTQSEDTGSELLTETLCEV